MSCGALGSGGDPDAQAGKGWGWEGGCLDLRLEVVNWGVQSENAKCRSYKMLMELGTMIRGAWKFISGFTDPALNRSIL